MSQPVGPIPVQAPVPSILTTARDRTSDGFGASAPLPEGVEDTLAAAGAEAGRASWRSGISWQSYACQVSHPWPDCPAEGQADKERSDFDGPTTTGVFHLYTPIDCDWAGAVATLEAAARALNGAQTAYGVARALWMGEGYPAASTWPTLRNSATDVGGATPDDLDLVVATLLGRYEQATGGLGGAVLHIPSIMFVGALGGLPGGGKVATPEGNVYRGPLGSLLSPGPGYPWGESTEGADGYGPLVGADTYAGSAPDEAWVYVTGPVEYALSPIRVLDSDSPEARRMNTSEVIAERAGIVRFDPCTAFAALADNPYAQGGS